MFPHVKLAQAAELHDWISAEVNPQHIALSFRAAPPEHFHGVECTENDVRWLSSLRCGVRWHAQVVLMVDADIDPVVTDKLEWCRKKGLKKIAENAAHDINFSMPVNLRHYQPHYNKDFEDEPTIGKMVVPHVVGFVDFSHEKPIEDPDRPYGEILRVTNEFLIALRQSWRKHMFDTDALDPGEADFVLNRYLQSPTFEPIIGEVAENIHNVLASENIAYIESQYVILHTHHRPWQDYVKAYQNIAQSLAAQEEGHAAESG
ncbi:hypothetical protein HYZ99_02865 [Candidatus Peregrinibacteria bacterium]|nr:hypothetical protein [Candidatus Peregrinibacteria bacterium]